jgi:hypothetical protein
MVYARILARSPADRPARFLRQLARVAAKHTTRDSTKYRPAALARSDSTTGSASRTPSRHDGRPQQDPREGILKLKKTVLQRRAA